MEQLQTTWEWMLEWIWLILPLALLQLTLLVTALISVLRKKVTGVEKLPWILLIVILNTLGPLIYFLFGAGYLDEKIAGREDGE